MDYLEPLPEECPPVTAIDVAYEVVWRVVSQLEPTAEDFASHAARGWPKRPTVTDCDHASCSVFTNKTTVERLAGRLPKTRIPEPHLAELTIPKGFGRSLAGGPHVHLWMYAGSNPLPLVRLTEKCNGAS